MSSKIIMDSCYNRNPVDLRIFSGRYNEILQKT